MADAVGTRVILDSEDRYIAHFTNVSDGTGESAVVKVDKSAIRVASDGAEPAALDIERVIFNCEGMQVRVLWDHDTDDLGLILSGNGEIDLKGKHILDPRSAGVTGDILFTTVGHTSGDTYNITLFLRKSPT